MLHVFIGTDREKTRAELDKAVSRFAGKKTHIARITDANAVSDLQTVLQGAGMFPPGGGQAGKEVAIFDGVLSNEEMRERLLRVLPVLRDSSEQFFILEEKLDAETKRAVEKYAEEKTQRFDLPAGRQARQNGGIFALANALKKSDKKALWVGYQRELARGNAPEAIHGVLFWGAKDMFLKSRDGTKERHRAAELVAKLAELPHEARRKNVELEYALERFILSTV